MITRKKIFPGILLCFIISLLSSSLGNLFPLIGGPVFGILIGMVVVLLFPGILVNKYFRLQDGVAYTSKKLLMYAIILLGFGLNLFTIFTVGGQSLLVILFTLVAAFLTAWIIGKLLKLDSILITLIGVGTAICGGSAIAAVAPILRAKDEDIVHAISTIFLFNILAVFLFPPLGHWLQLSDTGFGMWAGTAINDTSSVVAAATAWSAVSETDTALTTATVVKLTRTLMIIPITLALALYIARENKNNLTEKQTFHFAKVFPWFILGFVTASLITTFLPISSSFSDSAVSLGKFLIIMAMAAIGLQTHLNKLLKNGIKPITLGLACWFTVAAVSLIVQMSINMW